MKKLIALIVVALAGSVGAVEYGYITATNGSQFVRTVTLGSGDCFSVVSYTEPFNCFLEVPDGEKFRFSISDRLIGPGTVYLEGDGGYSPGSIYISYAITRSNNASTSPVNVISLKPDPAGDIELVFETSDDLVTWSPVYSFTHSSTNHGSQFFRTRVVKE